MNGADGGGLHVQSIQSWLGIVTALLTILGVVVALTRHFTRMQEQADRQKIEAEKQGLAAKVEELQSRQAELLDQIAVGSRAGNAALAMKSSLDRELQALMRTAGASGGSIYVPVRSPRGEAQGLAFLSIEPFSPQTQALKSKLIPLKSLAGRSFATGQSFAITDAGGDPAHFKQAAKLAHYHPTTMLNVAVRRGDETIGVLQLLSREREAGFTDADVTVVEGALGGIPDTIAAIMQSPDYLRILGVGQEENRVSGTVLYFDLSRSSRLFEELSSTFALQLLNEFFERMCDAAFKHGATLDTYMGDGALMRFNVPRPMEDHAFEAVRPVWR